MVSYKYRINYRIMSKISSRATDSRIDIRFPPDVLAAIEAIAVAENAAIHHISKKPILTPTVIELVRLGLAQVSDRYGLELSDNVSPSLSGNLSDAVNKRIDAIEGEVSQLKKLMSELSDKLSVTNPIVSDNQSDSLSVTSQILSDNESDNQLGKEYINPKLKKFYSLTESDRAEVCRLLGDGIPQDERNDGLSGLLGWKPTKSIKSMNEDASRWRGVLRDEGLIETAN